MYALVTLAGISPNDSQISLEDLLPISSSMVKYVSHIMPMSEKNTKLKTCDQCRPPCSTTQVRSPACRLGGRSGTYKEPDE